MTALSLVNELLRSPDELKAILEVAQLTSDATTTAAGSSLDSRNRRVLAIVSHKDDWDMTEEGSLFVLKSRWMNTTAGTTAAGAGAAGGQHEELEVQKVFPIYGDFSVVMSQMKRGTLNLGTSTSAATLSRSVLDQPRSVITLSINPAEGLVNDTPAPSFYTNDVEALRTLVTECKRLKEVSDVDTNAVINLAQSTTHFSWLKPYFSKRTTISALTSMPQDLRQINQPLLERLSQACAGHIADEHADVQVMRNDWIRIKAQEMSRKGRRKLTLRLGTFNVNGKMPTQDLSAWVQGISTVKKEGIVAEKQVIPSPVLPPFQKLSPFALARNSFDWITRKPSSSSQIDTTDEEQRKDRYPPLRVDLDDPDDPDMLVFGFQELDLSTEALLYATGTLREDAWCHAIFAALGEKGVKYEKLASKQLVGMLVLVIVKKSLKDCFSDVKTSIAGAGLMGVMGNKGGTAIRLSFTPPLPSPTGVKETESVHTPGPTTFTFVNSHLAAFDEMVDKRNLDFQDLSKRLVFGHTDHINRSKTASVDSTSSTGHGEGEHTSTGSISDSSESELTTQGFGLNAPLTVYETDMLFWMVNLNYRLDIPDLDLRRILRDEEWETRQKFDALLRFDQLKNSIKKKKAFVGFHEHPITHMPTYRFSPGLMMDKLGYDMKRKPAWTDRILYMDGPACHVTPLSYAGFPQITLSDHRPLASDFSVDVDFYDADEYHANVTKLFNSVNHLDSETSHDKGGLKIDDMFVDFEKIYYGKPIERKIALKNTGKTACAFRFVPIQQDSPIHPEWLQIYPINGVLLPGESSEIVLRAEIGNAVASVLNLGPRDLSGTLILHTIFGKDHFISVSAEYQYTCFANKLSWLTRLRGPIRTHRSPQDLLPDSQARNAPKEIIRLVNWMMTNHATAEDIFISQGTESAIDTIRECLDTGDEFPYPAESSSAEIRLAFATTLLRFLNSLPQAVIPTHLHAQCLQMTNRDEAFELLDELHPTSVNVWISITAFLHFTCQSINNEDQVSKIASVIAPILLKDDPDSVAIPISPKGKCRFLMYFIT